MSTPKHILFPYDFSPQCQQVVPFIRALAHRAGARVTIFGVVPPTFDVDPSHISSQVRVGDDPEQWRLALQSRLDSALVREFEDIPVVPAAECGDPAVCIARFAGAHQVDLIMMPTHGLGVLRALFLGSVTTKVLHEATCPVWTAAHLDTQSASPLPKTILCAADGTPTTSALMQWSYEFSSKLGASLHLLHVVQPTGDWPSLPSERRLQEQAREEARNTFVSHMKAAGVDVPYRVAVGDITPTVAEEARREQADLVIVGRGSVSEPFGRLRTHVFGIIQQSPCPVLSV